VSACDSDQLQAVVSATGAPLLRGRRGNTA
jgi:hypothetical protein